MRVVPEVAQLLHGRRKGVLGCVAFAKCIKNALGFAVLGGGGGASSVTRWEVHPESRCSLMNDSLTGLEQTGQDTIDQEVY